MVTINDVAKKAGVSKSSVSRVLNNNYEYMSEDTKIKILKAVSDLNYVPNQVAQSLKRKITKTIGIILSDISNPFWAEVLKGVQSECTQYNYTLMVSSSGEDPSSEEKNLINFKNRQVDGVIVNTTGQNFELFRDLISEEYPIVFLDRFHKDMKADTVIVNNLDGAEKSIQHLINEGHKRIGIVSYQTLNKSPRIDRLKGYKKALKKNDIEIDDDLIKIFPQVNGNGITATKELLSLVDRPTAIFSTNTILNLEVLTGIRESNLSVPRDVSLIGYDDYPWVPLLNPPLSTVAQPAIDMGRKAAYLLIQRLEKKDKQGPRTVQLDPTLVIRASSTLASRSFHKTIE